MGNNETEDRGRSLPGPGTFLLALAAVLVAGSITYRSYDPESADEVVEVADGAPVSVEELRRRAEASDGDAMAWQELGFAHFQRGEFTEAVDAYGKALEYDEDEAVLWSALGEARVMASRRDPMPAEALAAFRKAAELDPRDPRARYFLAVDKDLGGNHRGAIDDWLALLADTTPGAPWESDLVRTIEQVGAIHGIDVAPRIAEARSSRLPLAVGQQDSMPGPTREQIAAAGSIPPSEQREMARDMVARLERRLEDDPANIDGWVMLMRSRVTLGEPGRASEALKAALRANPGEAIRLRREADALGVS